MKQIINKRDYLLFDQTSDFKDKLPAETGSPCRVILTSKMIACLRKIIFLLKLCILNRMLSTLKDSEKEGFQYRGRSIFAQDQK